MRFLTQLAAINLDKDLMSMHGGFSIDQLMELAGLSVASAFWHAFSTHLNSRVLAVAGPGNNGGDALVASRHLRHFGFTNISVLYPKPSPGPLFQGLVTSLEAMDIAVYRDGQNTMKHDEMIQSCDIILDGVFGFSFDPSKPIRPPFDTILALLRKSVKPIVSIDIPSGWHVEKGDVGVGVVLPQVLISLSAPKLCAKGFHGRHFLGGRFLPPGLVTKYALDLPQYKGVDQVVDITGECHDLGEKEHEVGSKLQDEKRGTQTL